MTDEPNLNDRILAHLADHPDSTSIDIARGIEADWWDVQMAVCLMAWNESVIQTGNREIEDARAKPMYRVAPTKESA